MLISNQIPLLAQGTLVTPVSGAHVGHSKASRRRKGMGEGSVLFYAAWLKCPEKLMRSIILFLHSKSIFNALAFAICVLFIYFYIW